MLIAKKFKKPLLASALIAVTLYAWEYYCTTRPVGTCGSICEKRAYLIGYYGKRALEGSICTPWYRWFTKP